MLLCKFSFILKDNSNISDQVLGSYYKLDTLLYIGMFNMAVRQGRDATSDWVMVRAVKYMEGGFS